MGIAMASASRGRLLELAKLQCSIFSTPFNPNQQRLGNKILRARLRGPALAAYYPRSSTWKDTMKMRSTDLKTYRSPNSEARALPRRRERLPRVGPTKAKGSRLFREILKICIPGYPGEEGILKS